MIIISLDKNHKKIKNHICISVLNSLNFWKELIIDFSDGSRHFGRRKGWVFIL